MPSKKIDGVKYFLEGKTVRWTLERMPIPVLITPCYWYTGEYRQEDLCEMVLQAMDSWTEASENLISFRQVDYPVSNMVKVEWKRPTRKALGWCRWNYGLKRVMESADIEIGMPSPEVHDSYRGMDYLYHVILHEFGHAVGLDHTPFSTDVMHGRGGRVTVISAREKEYLRWNYLLPAGFQYGALGEKLGLPEPVTLLSVMTYLEQEGRLDEVLELPEAVQAIEPPSPASVIHNTDTGLDLNAQQDILESLGKFYMDTQPKKLYLFKPNQP